MNQIPVAPLNNPYMVQQQTTYMPIPQQQPNYNAVKIDIHNPTVGVDPMAQCQPQYAQPTMPYYTYPQAPIYNYPTAQQVPSYPPMQIPAAPQPATTPVAVDAPVPANQQPSVIQQQNVNYPPMPPVQPEQVPVKPEAPAVPEPAVSEPTVAKPEVVPSEPITPQVDLNSFLARLSNPDFDVQEAAMNDIAKIVETTPDKATELIDSKVFDALVNIVNADTSALEGPTPEQIAAREKINSGAKDVTDADKELANKATPKDFAERNKCYALYRIANLQKLYADEVARLSNQTVPLTEMPAISTVVDNLKDNPNPFVRASAIEALSYIQNPAYKDDLTTVFTVALNDEEPGVAETAKAALDKLNQM
ncbi:MAG: hypothetical protein ACI37Q_07550 [Candidatus Gastranaerophilaceae bacterium]